MGASYHRSHGNPKAHGVCRGMEAAQKNGYRMLERTSEALDCSACHDFVSVLFSSLVGVFFVFSMSVVKAGEGAGEHIPLIAAIAIIHAMLTLSFTRVLNGLDGVY